MIKLICGKCGSDNVVAGKYRYTFHCNNCDTNLELWDTQLLPADPKETDNVSTTQTSMPTLR